MENLRVREIMQSEVITVRPDTTMRDLADIMAENKISGVPVIDDERRVVGMVSESDVILQDADLHFPYYFQFLDSIIYIHPTLSETIGEAALKAENKALHILNS